MSDELHQKSDSIKLSRKFRWSSCLSFVSNKLKRNSKLNNSKSFETFRPPAPVQKRDSQTKYSQVKTVPVLEPILPSQWKQPISALSPPPRQPKVVKRETVLPNTRKDRIPLVDPTLTPRVRPFSRGRQQSFLRLSLDAECLAQEDVSSLSTRSSLSVPLRCGSTKRTSDASIPIKWTHSSFESPLNDSFISQIDEEELGLKDKRHRKSPLSLPDSLTFDDDLLDKSLLFQDRSRQDTMRILEGNNPSVDKLFNEPEISLQTISENHDSSILETPPHRHLAPSLVSFPSSLNSLDSSVIEHEDYASQQHALAVFLASN